MAGYTYANTSLFTHYLLAKTDESIYVGAGEISTDPSNGKLEATLSSTIRTFH
jgi:hypothetical protein